MSIDERLITTATPDADAPAVVVRVAGTSGVGALVDQGNPNAGGALAWPVVVTNTSFAVTGPLTNTELRAAPVVITGAVLTI